MQPSELAANFNATVVVAEGMRKAGFKVDIQPPDWGTLSQRRNNKGPVDASNKGGWNLFITVATALLPRRRSSRATDHTKGCVGPEAMRCERIILRAAFLDFGL